MLSCGCNIHGNQHVSSILKFIHTTNEDFVQMKFDHQGNLTPQKNIADNILSAT